MQWIAKCSNGFVELNCLADITALYRQHEVVEVAIFKVSCVVAQTFQKSEFFVAIEFVEISFVNRATIDTKPDCNIVSFGTVDNFVEMFLWNITRIDTNFVCTGFDTTDSKTIVKMYISNKWNIRLCTNQLEGINRLSIWQSNANDVATSTFERLDLLQSSINIQYRQVCHGLDRYGRASAYFDVFDGCFLHF